MTRSETLHVFNLPASRASPPQAQPIGGSIIRRLSVVAPVILTIAALLVAMAPTDVDARSRMRLGISGTVGADPRHINTVKDFTATVTAAAGASAALKPATWTIWSTWGDPETRWFPTKLARQLRKYGVTPMIWWEPMKDRGSCAYAKHWKIAQGRFDRYITRWARQAKKFGGKVIVRYAHEINGAYFPWTVQQCGNTAEWYKRGWRHVYKLVRNRVGAKNVKFLWTVAKQKRPPGVENQYQEFYPGDRYVQFVGFSSFNWGTEDGKKWVDMVTGIDFIMRYLTQFTTKPIIVAELASNSVGGDKADWIRTGFAGTYANWPQIKGLTWLNVDLRPVGHPNWSLYYPDASVMDAYAAMASQRRFQGRF